MYVGSFGVDGEKILESAGCYGTGDDGNGSF